ncbi:hypothetical protein LY78DRAFT_302166 [Colletotrichum sublineola]|nr:hypothetical protein LY78DRAFT_302166 [Colletotrichum sublineola]
MSGGRGVAGLLDAITTPRHLYPVSHPQPSYPSHSLATLDGQLRRFSLNAPRCCSSPTLTSFAEPDSEMGDSLRCAAHPTPMEREQERTFSSTCYCSLALGHWQPSHASDAPFRTYPIANIGNSSPIWFTRMMQSNATRYPPPSPRWLGCWVVVHENPSNMPRRAAARQHRQYHDLTPPPFRGTARIRGTDTDP